MVKYISSSDQLADVLIKSLPSPQFHFLVHKLMGVPPLRLKSDVREESKSRRKSGTKSRK